MVWTLQDIQTHCTQEIGNDQINDMIRSWTNLGQKTMTSYRNFWFMETTTSLSTVISSTTPNELTLPVTFKQPIVMVDTVNNEIVDYALYTDIKGADPYNVPTGNPDKYTIYGGSIYLNATPTSNITYDFSYYRVPTDLVNATDTVDIPDRFIHTLLSYVTAMGLLYERRAQESNIYFELFKSGVTEMIKEATRNPSYTHQTVPRNKLVGWSLTRKLDTNNPLV